MKMANDGFLSSARASRPRISPTETSAPTFFGGVCGSVNENRPNATDSAAGEVELVGATARPRAG